MKNKLLLILLSGLFIITGCATVQPVKKEVNAPKVIYTDAPAGVAFDAAASALKNLGCKVDEKNMNNFFVKGFYFHVLTKDLKIYVRIKVDREKTGSKIECIVDRPGAAQVMDVPGYLNANDIYKEMAKILAQEQFDHRKAIEEKKKEEEREAMKGDREGPPGGGRGGPGGGGPGGGLGI